MIYKQTKHIIIKLICLIIFFVTASNLLNITDYYIKNTLAMHQMDIYSGSALLQFYSYMVDFEPIIYIVIFVLVFRKEFKTLINKMKNKEKQNEEIF